MARKAAVRFFESRNAYYCQHKGKQYRLGEGPEDGKDDGPSGPKYNAALAEFRRLFEPQGDGRERDVVPVRVIWEKYREYLQEWRSENTLRIRANALERFAERFGDRAVGTLCHQDVYDFLRDMKQWRVHPKLKCETRWTNGTVRNAVVSLTACFKWAQKSGLIAVNPFVGLERPQRTSRSEETVFEPEQWEVIKAKVSGHALEFIKVLEATGARPGEITNATADHFDPVEGALVHKAQVKEGEFAHKNRRHKKDRVILLSGEALEIVRRRAAKYHKGPLFGKTTRAERGKDVTSFRPWTQHDVTALMKRVRRKTGLKHLIAYSFRHTFVTNWIRSGRSVEYLAELLGTSPEMIREHYNHLFRFKSDLRRALEEFRSPPVPKPVGRVVVQDIDGRKVRIVYPEPEEENSPRVVGASD